MTKKGRQLNFSHVLSGEGPEFDSNITGPTELSISQTIRSRHPPLPKHTPLTISMDHSPSDILPTAPPEIEPSDDINPFAADKNTSRTQTPPMFHTSSATNRFLDSPCEAPTRSQRESPELLSFNPITPLATPPSAVPQDDIQAVNESTEPLADFLATWVADVSQVTAYVRMLERRKIAGDKSIQAKLQRIAELEAENALYVMCCLENHIYSPVED